MPAAQSDLVVIDSEYTLEELESALRDNMLVTLDLEYHDLCDGDFVARLAAALKDTSALSSLSLAHGRMSPSTVGLLWPVVGCMRGLTSLNLSACALAADDAFGLFKALSSASAGGIVTLDLADNRLADTGCKAAAAMLCKNATITSLNVENNGVTDQGCFAMAFALESHNTTLMHLDLKHNQIAGKGAVALAAALVSNHSVHTVELDHNPIDDIHIIRAIQHKCQANSNQTDVQNDFAANTSTNRSRRSSSAFSISSPFWSNKTRSIAEKLERSWASRSATFAGDSAASISIASVDAAPPQVEEKKVRVASTSTPMPRRENVTIVHAKSPEARAPRRSAPNAVSGPHVVNIPALSTSTLGRAATFAGPADASTIDQSFALASDLLVDLPDHTPQSDASFVDRSGFNSSFASDSQASSRVEAQVRTWQDDDEYDDEDVRRGATRSAYSRRDESTTRRHASGVLNPDSPRVQRMRGSRGRPAPASASAAAAHSSSAISTRSPSSRALVRSSIYDRIHREVRQWILDSSSSESDSDGSPVRRRRPVVVRSPDRSTMGTATSPLAASFVGTQTMSASFAGTQTMSASFAGTQTASAMASEATQTVSEGGTQTSPEPRAMSTNTPHRRSFADIGASPTRDQDPDDAPVEHAVAARMSLTGAPAPNRVLDRLRTGAGTSEYFAYSSPSYKQSSRAPASPGSRHPLPFSEDASSPMHGARARASMHTSSHLASTSLSEQHVAAPTRRSFAHLQTPGPSRGHSFAPPVTPARPAFSQLPVSASKCVYEPPPVPPLPAAGSPQIAHVRDAALRETAARLMERQRELEEMEERIRHERAHLHEQKRDLLRIEQEMSANHREMLQRVDEHEAELRYREANLTIAEDEVRDKDEVLNARWHGLERSLVDVHSRLEDVAQRELECESAMVETSERTAQLVRVVRHAQTEEAKQ